MNANSSKNIFLWAIIIVAALFAINISKGETVNGQVVENVTYTEFARQLESGRIIDGKMNGENVVATTTNGTTIKTVQPLNSYLSDKFIEKEIPLEIASQEPSAAGSIFRLILPMLLFFALFMFLMSRMSGKGGISAFGKSKSKLLTEMHGKVTFDDVAGIDDARADLEEIVYFLKDPKKFSDLGAKIPKGALLVGPPGTGKTLLARAVAGEAGVPFFTTSGSDFVEMFVGVGASRVRDMFEQAKKNAPCIIFIDEIDAMGRARGSGTGGGNDEREQTLNQMLVEMDGFEGNEGIIILAATNRPDVLDPALLRPGRFDRQVTVGNPDVKGRISILNVHARKVPLGGDVDFRVIARGTPGFSGADLANLVNESAINAALKGDRQVSMRHFESAKDKIMLGAERRGMVMSEDERKLTAYHEAGHAIVGLNTPDHDPIHKATIVPRGRALGLVLSLPERDRLSVSLRQYKSKIAMAMGGKVAEEIIFGSEYVTSGATSDIQQATKIARAMVTEFGFSKSIGNINYANKSESFLGAQEGPISASPETKAMIEREVRTLIDDGYELARKILTEKNDDLHLLAQALLERETLSGDEIKALLARQPLTSATQEGVVKGSVPSIPKIKLGPKLFPGDIALG